MITKKELYSAFERLAELSGYATTEEQARAKSQPYFLYMEYNKVYGGYRIVLTKIDTHGHAGAFGGNGSEGRLNSREMYTKIHGIIQGILFARALDLAKKQPKKREQYYHNLPAL